VLGAVSGNPGAAGTGLLAATKQSMTSRFREVRRVKAVKKRHGIYLNEALTRNQIYAEPEDFDYVRDYILWRCQKKKR
jgi:hypothetical protein